MTTNSAQNTSLPRASLYVGDLHPAVTDAMLYSIFNSVGNVLSARVCRDVAGQSSLGYGYVNFENPKDAERALEQLIYDDLMGRQIRIMWCVRDPSLRKSGKGNIFIKNLDKKINQKDLYETFKHFGKILSCKIAFDEAGHSKGYGFIHFEEEECAKTAISNINGKMINERIVYVGPFIPKSQRKVSAGKPKFNNCYVKNFSTDLDDEGLKELFVEFGEIKSACIMKDEQGKSKGFGFVCFINPDSAEAAVNAMNNKEVNGQTLYVSRAQRKEERQELLRQQYEKQRSERLSKYSQGTNLYVKNLDDTIDDARLKDAFSKYGKITSAKVMLDQSGNSKGFGFVCFSTPEEAKEAAKLSGTLMGSKPLYVALAQRREDRRAKLLAEHQQRLQYRPNAANIPPNIPNFIGQIPFNATQRFYPANAAMGSSPRWNRGMAGPQVQLGHPGIGAASALRPNLASPYVGGAASMAMGQSQLTAQSNLINPQFRGQPGARNMMPNPMAGLGAGPSNGLVAGQQYGAQRPGMPGQMLGASGPLPRQTMASVSANIRPGPVAQPNAPGIAAPTTNASVRFNQTSRNTMSTQSQGSRTMASPVRVEPTAAVEQHTTAGHHEGVAAGDAGKGSESKRLTEAERQALGDKIYHKILKDDSSLAGKLTGMIIQMDGSFVRKVVDNDAELEQAVKECKIALAKKERDQAKAAEGQSSEKN
ncbi:unnamed protein product [Hymenolepis diminuta]|uniref:Polyadenylate-binding protein n=1 Tax=Hymenolepis diminuta TaxID=6216 RepID=A0A0R3SXX8_HYMDI|nr:unnamed protein product [Hymenolepis diminuta]